MADAALFPATRIQVEGFRGINNEADPLELKFRPDTVNSRLRRYMASEKEFLV